MIDFETYETVKLGDVAEFGRAKKDKVYPAGCSTIQISATKGQIGFLTHARTVEAKYAVIRPQAGINERYFYTVMQNNVARFMKQYVADINIQINEIANFPIQLHNVETQKAIADMMMYMDDKADTIESEIAGLKKLKKAMLQKLMV